ncbi:MAG: hypothetical protein J7K04_02660 [Spirochaetales bacterium]|nr:hypothetical protein [Spirochaetales bacterium]
MDTTATALVNINTGSNDNSGISTAPKVCIQAGIDAAALGISAVRISEGTYEGLGPVVTLVEGVSIYGGYKDGDWSVRNTATYITTIRDTDISTSSTILDPHRALEASAGDITSTTIVDGAPMAFI